MNEAIKNYGELKQLINHGEKVTLDGKLMTNEKVNSMPMAEVRLCIEQGDFKAGPAIEGEFIGKDDKPQFGTTAQHEAMRQAAWAQQAAMGQVEAGIYANLAASQQRAASQAIGAAGLGASLFGGMF